MCPKFTYAVNHSFSQWTWLAHHISMKEQNHHVKILPLKKKKKNQSYHHSPQPLAWVQLHYTMHPKSSHTHLHQCLPFFPISQCLIIMKYKWVIWISLQCPQFYFKKKASPWSVCFLGEKKGLTLQVSFFNKVPNINPAYQRNQLVSRHDGRRHSSSSGHHRFQILSNLY